MERSFERDIIPMARSEGKPSQSPPFTQSNLPSPGLALAPWNVLAAGKLRTDAEEARRRETGEKGRTGLNPDWERTEDQKKMSRALEKVAGEVGAESITAGVWLPTPSVHPSLKPRTDVVYPQSRNRLPDAKSPVRVPHHRRAQSRAPPRQHPSARHFPHARAYRVPREHRTVRPGVPE